MIYIISYSFVFYNPLWYCLVFIMFFVIMKNNTFWFVKNLLHCYFILERLMGVEPTTVGFRDQCSTTELLPRFMLCKYTISIVIKVLIGGESRIRTCKEQQSMLLSSQRGHALLSSKVPSSHQRNACLPKLPSVFPYYATQSNGYW